MTISELIEFLQDKIKSGEILPNAKIQCLGIDKDVYYSNYKWDSKINKPEDFITFDKDYVDFGIEL